MLYDPFLFANIRSYNNLHARNLFARTCSVGPADISHGIFHVKRNSYAL